MAHLFAPPSSRTSWDIHSLIVILLKFHDILAFFTRKTISTDMVMRVTVRVTVAVELSF